jgi:hypothetical protein
MTESITLTSLLSCFSDWGFELDESQSKDQHLLELKQTLEGVSLEATDGDKLVADIGIVLGELIRDGLTHAQALEYVTSSSSRLGCKPINWLRFNPGVGGVDTVLVAASIDIDAPTPTPEPEGGIVIPFQRPAGGKRSHYRRPLR